MSVTLTFTRDLENRRVAVELDTGDHESGDPITKWGQLGLRFARQISEVKKFDFSPHIHDGGTSITLSDDDFDEWDDEYEDDWEDDLDHECAASEILRSAQGDEPEAEEGTEEVSTTAIDSQFNYGDAYQRIGGFEAPSVVLGHLVFKLLTRALKRAEKAEVAAR